MARFPLTCESVSRRDKRGATPAGQRRADRAGLGDGKDDYGNPVLASKSEGGRVHHGEIFGDRLVMGQRLIAPCARIALGVGGIDAVDLSGLEHGVGREFGGAQHGARCRW